MAHLPTWRLAAFASPAGPLLALSLAPLVFLADYYERALDIPIATTFAALFAARLFDIVIDPLIGAWQDKTVSRHGRRKLWLMLALPVLMALVVIIFFLMPARAGFWLLAPIMLAHYAVFAAMMIAHLGWAGEVESDYHARTRVLGAVQIASVVGQILMLSLPAAIEALELGSVDDGVRAMGCAVLVLLPASTLLALRFAPEPPAPAADHAHILDAWRALKANRSLRAVLLPDLLIGVVQGLTASLFLFYAAAVLDLEAGARTLLFLFFVAGLAGIPAWAVLSRRLGKHKALQASCLFQAGIVASLLLVPPGVFWAAAVVICLAGFGSSAGVFLIRSMLADVVDEDRLATGLQRSGLFFGLLLTTTKVGLAVGPAAGAWLGLLGFDAEAGTGNSDAALGALTLMFVGGPVLLQLAVAAVLRNYPLDEARQRQLRDAIAARSVER